MKLLFFTLLISICTCTTAQEYSNKTIIQDLFGANQLFDFGTYSTSNDFVEYSNNPKKQSKIKGVKGITRIIYTAFDQVYKAEINFLSPMYFDEYKKKLDLMGLQSFKTLTEGFWGNKVTDFYCINDFSIIPENGKIIVYNNAFVKPTINFDEFEKMSSFCIRPVLDMFSNNNLFDIYFSTIKIPDTKLIIIDINYTGDKWMFINEIQILLDNGEVIPIKLTYKRDTRELSCSEICTGTISEDQAKTIINQTNAKIRISGENFNEDFQFPLPAKSSLKYALNQYNNL